MARRSCSSAPRPLPSRLPLIVVLALGVLALGTMAAVTAGPVFAAEPSSSVADGERLPLTLSFVGDIMHHLVNAEMPDYDRIYDSVRRLLHVDDLSFANLEFPVDPDRPPAGYPLFNGSVEYVAAAVRGGFDVFALANNHTWDLGLSGSRSTARVMEDLSRHAPVHVNGIRSARSKPIAATEIMVRGWRVGFVSITSFSNLPGSSAHINLVNYFDDEVRDAFLSRVAGWSSEFDLFVVGVHAGDEYVQVPADHKAAFLRDLSDAGAHIVWGHHPHVLQPWERRNGGVIIHSAGNFISGQRRHQSAFVPVGRWAPTGDTAVYQLRVETGDEGPTVTAVRTPRFTVYHHPRHGLVLRSFREMIAEPLPAVWRAFYLARYAAATR